MKFVRFGDKGNERPGVVDGAGVIRDLSAHVSDISGAVLGNLAQFSDLDLSALPAVPDNVRIAPCVGGVGKFICIGLNYVDHAKETGAEIPSEPIVFMKNTSSISGPNDDVVIPKNSTKTDWEVELGIIIGKEVRYVDEAQAEDAIAGYCLINDLSERAFQLERGGQWSKGKGCDTFGPIGPWLVTPDEVGDPCDLAMWLEVDGKRYQNSTTANMIFKPAFIVSYLSQFMSLHPGDVISTGTPPGVGLGLKPQVFLRAGQTIRLAIEKLGEQQQRTVAYA